MRFLSTNRPSFGAIGLPHTAHRTGFGFRKNIEGLRGPVYARRLGTSIVISVVLHDDPLGVGPCLHLLLGQRDVRARVHHGVRRGRSTQREAPETPWSVFQ